MELKNQVVSLGLAKKLKELGIKQGSLFHWCHYKQEKKWFITFNIEASKAIDLDDIYSAFTVAELGEMLPIETRSVYLGGSGWICQNNHYKEHFYAETEADARAKMLVYLKENKLI